MDKNRCKFYIVPDTIPDVVHRCVLDRGHKPENIHETEWTVDGAPPEMRARLIVTVDPAPRNGVILSQLLAEDT